MRKGSYQLSAISDQLETEPKNAFADS